MQTRVYRALLVDAGAHLNNNQPFAPEQIEMIYWFADFPTEPARFVYKADQYKRDWDALLKIADEIKTASLFPLTDEVSKCNFCPYRSYCNRGVRAGDAAEIASFCDLTYGVNFPMFAKVDVNGDNTAPLFEHLKKAAPGLLGSENVKWNFTKFLVSPDGTVKRFAPQDAPASLAKDIEKVLG